MSWSDWLSLAARIAVAYAAVYSVIAVCLTASSLAHRRRQRRTYLDLYRQRRISEQVEIEQMTADVIEAAERELKLAVVRDRIWRQINEEHPGDLTDD